MGTVVIDQARYYDVLTDVLTAYENGWPVDPALPTRRYVTTLPVVVDCELLAVELVSAFTHSGDPTAPFATAVRARPAHILTGIRLAVTLIRCVPIAREVARKVFPPTAAQMTGSAATICADAVLLTTVLAQAEKDGDIGGCASLAFINWAPVSGGDFGGGRLEMVMGTERRQVGS